MILLYRQFSLNKICSGVLQLGSLQQRRVCKDLCETSCGCRMLAFCRVFSQSKMWWDVVRLVIWLLRQVLVEQVENLILTAAHMYNCNDIYICVCVCLSMCVCVRVCVCVPRFCLFLSNPLIFRFQSRRKIDMIWEFVFLLIKGPGRGCCQSHFFQFCFYFVHIFHLFHLMAPIGTYVVHLTGLLGAVG